MTGPAHRGDEAELFRRYAQRLLRVVRGAIGERRDVSEDACAFAWLQLLRTQPERDLVFRWLCVVATNEARSLLKGQARRSELEQEAARSVASPVSNTADLELTLEVHEALEHIAELNAQKARIFSLHVAGLTYEEICAATGYSWAQVNRHLVRSRVQLRARRDGLRSKEG